MTAWDEIVSAALLGTARKSIPPPAGDDVASALLSGLDPAEPERYLLRCAAVAALRRRAGYKPAQLSGPLPEPAPRDDLPRCSPRAAEHLALMIEGHQRNALTQWLELVAAAGKRVPETILPALLDFGRGKPVLRGAIVAVVGARGRWLVKQDARWDYWVDEDTGDVWANGTFSARHHALRWLRTTNPGHARELLAGTWAAENPADRRKFLATFGEGLSMADEPFLEEVALDDTGAQVGNLAARLLGRLPESRLSRRMVERVDALLALTGEGEIEVTPPAAFDAGMARDRIVERPGRNHASDDVRLWWFQQMLKVVPPSHWSRKWGASPAEIAAMAAAGEHGAMLLDTWMLAAGQHRDADWAEALLPFELHPADQTHLYALMGALPPDRREAIILKMLVENPQPLRATHPALMLLRLSPHAWSEDLALAVLDNWRRYLAQGNARPDSDMREALKGFALTVPPSVYYQARRVLTIESQGGRLWDNAVTQFLLTLAFRRDMIEAIGELSE